jgi:hypothetical protein
MIISDINKQIRDKRDSKRAAKAKTKVISSPKEQLKQSKRLNALINMQISGIVEAKASVSTIVENSEPITPPAKAALKSVKPILREVHLTIRGRLRQDFKTFLTDVRLFYRRLEAGSI